MKLNFALIGAGSISKYYLKAIKNNKDVNLIAICDIDKTKKFLAKKIGVRFYTDYKSMINKEKINCAIVLTPNSTHFNIVNDCLLRQINVLCEKPLCINYQQTKKLIVMAQKRKLKLITAYHRRFNKKIIKLKEYSRDIKIRTIHFRYLEDINKHSSGEKWYFDINKSGGGCLLDNGINVIDILQYLLGDLRVKFVHLGYKKILCSNHDVNAYIMMDNDDGSQCTVELDWFYNSEIKDLSVYFENGKVVRIDLLKGHKRFKSSLWHEYKNIICDTILLLKNKNIIFDSPTLKTSELIDKIYNC